MKVVVLQQLVGKGYLIHNNIIESYKNNYYENNKGYKESQVVLKKCMKSVKNWCNKNGYEYILNTKDLGWNYYNPAWEKIGFTPCPDREMDFCSQRFQSFKIVLCNKP